MLFGFLALLMALLIVCCFAPGFFFVRRLRWTPLEKLCGSVGLSLILLYLAAWAVYCFGPHDERISYRIVAAAAVLMGAAAWRDAWRFFRIFRVRQALAGFGFLALFVLVMLAMIRVYSGAGWAGDWFEHFHRSLFFLKRLPPHITIYPAYQLPARPPMMNVLAAFFMGLTDDRFALFQVIFGFLNILLFLPCLLVLPTLGDLRRRGLLPLVVLLAASPVVMVNATYSWSKSLTVFYVILALSLYLAGWRKRDSVRTVAAFLALAAGLLVHYSAGPYIAILTAHYLIRFFRERPLRWRELAAVAVACGLLVGTWFAWSASVYGAKATFGSNTSVTSSEHYQGSNLEKIALNLYDSVVPGAFRGQSQSWAQGNTDGTLRDLAFVWYQLNLVFGMGTVGGLVVLWLLYSRLVRGKPLPERVFWRWMVPVCVVLGIAVVGERDPGGVPHLTLVSLEVLGLALLAANFRRFPQVVQFLLIAAVCLDFYFGVFLEARMESLENTPQHVVYPEPRFIAGRFFFAGDGPEALGDDSWRAWMLKHRATLYPRWLREIPAAHQSDPLFVAAWPASRPFLEDGVADDARNWDNWGARHGGVEYLGDVVAGPSGQGVEIMTWVFALLFVASIGMLGRQSWKGLPAVRAPAPATGAARKAAARRARR
jgi:hypothetical protein